MLQRGGLRGLALCIAQLALLVSTARALELDEEFSAWRDAAASRDSLESSAQRWAAFANSERSALKYRRTRKELETFNVSCSHLAEAWVRTVRQHRALESVLVFDTRHRGWVRCVYL